MCVETGLVYRNLTKRIENKSIFDRIRHNIWYNNILFWTFKNKKERGKKERNTRKGVRKRKILINSHLYALDQTYYHNIWNYILLNLCLFVLSFEPLTFYFYYIFLIIKKTWGIGGFSAFISCVLQPLSVVPCFDIKSSRTAPFEQQLFSTEM